MIFMILMTGHIVMGHIFLSFCYEVRLGSAIDLVC